MLWHFDTLAKEGTALSQQTAEVSLKCAKRMNEYCSKVTFETTVLIALLTGIFEEMGMANTSIHLSKKILASRVS